mmetsp:Transcript_113585/g.244555  ORF Transcript_113585/g.244555 Transcript_113585/m.244555 type:complete len:308 (+) Transcript_113585:53-976(+)
MAALARTLLALLLIVAHVHGQDPAAAPDGAPRSLQATPSDPMAGMRRTYTTTRTTTGINVSAWTVIRADHVRPDPYADEAEATSGTGTVAAEAGGDAGPSEAPSGGSSGPAEDDGWFDGVLKGLPKGAVFVIATALALGVAIMMALLVTVLGKYSSVYDDRGPVRGDPRRKPKKVVLVTAVGQASLDEWDTSISTAQVAQRHYPATPTAMSLEDVRPEMTASVVVAGAKTKTRTYRNLDGESPTAQASPTVANPRPNQPRVGMGATQNEWLRKSRPAMKTQAAHTDSDRCYDPKLATRDRWAWAPQG